MNDGTIRVSVSEAAKLFGVSTKTIRDAIKSQQLRYIVVQNRYKIHFVSLIKWSQQSKRRLNKFEQSGIGQYVDKWKITTDKFSPRPPDNHQQ
jgi:excisionase family DNA binding protein